MKTLIARILLSLTALLVALLAAELVWRLWRTRHYGPTTNPAYVIHDSELGWRYKSGASVRHRSAEFDVAIDIDALGYRAPDAMSDEGRGSLLLLGDSFAFGWGVERSEMVASRLQAELPVVVSNRAVSGYGTDQELLLLRRELPLVRAQFVVLIFCPNDVDEVLRTVSYGKGKPCFALSSAPSTSALPALLPGNTPVPYPAWERWSLFARSLRKAVADASWEAPVGERLQTAQDLVVRMMIEMNRECAACDATLLIAHDEATWLDEKLLAVGLLPLDLGPALRAAAKVEPVTFATDRHWNRRGHAIAAKEIARVLLSIDQSRGE